ncbi:MAG: threonine--tRNA ligase [Planctomycetes bacterium]|nr:threonine--tRNA ligase [Planctomycetota bacterium]
MPDGKAIELVFPDGSKHSFPEGTTGAAVAASIGKRLAADALAVKLDGEIRDLNRPITRSAAFQVVTPLNRKKELDPDGLYCVRHSAAHVMAEALCRLWPETKLVYGPPVDDGFYYDIDLEHKISTEEFAKIEAEMKKIVAEKRPFTRVEMPRAEGMKKVQAEGNVYKVDNAERAEGDVLSFYVTGEKPGADFEDLCRGPHVPDTGRIGAYKVMSVAGAYWHGDASKQQLQRVYGTAFHTQEQLDKHLALLDEAKKRDHRKIGRELSIYAYDDEVGPGLPLWLPNGGAMIEELERLAKEAEFAGGYQRVKSPHICKEQLYIKSGHLPYYADSMFPPMEFEGVKYYIKPMNCPHHHKIFAAEPRSYRDLPLRLAEYGSCYRYEQSGELFGLMRVRSMQMNDAHIYCTIEQFEQEFLDVCKMYLSHFKVFGIDKFVMRFSTHGKEGLGKKYVNEPELWLKTEAMVRETLRKGDIPTEEVANEAAFYGPKIDVQVWSAIGREFTLATNQVDFAVPKRFNLAYKAADNTDQTPLCIHRAPLGTHERFIGFLIEHFAGNFPLWLAPQQVRVANITDKQEDFGKKVLKALRDAGLRADADFGHGKINAKVLESERLKIPYLLVIGEREAAAGSVAVRGRGRRDLGVLSLERFIEEAEKEVNTRALDTSLKA